MKKTREKTYVKTYVKTREKMFISMPQSWKKLRRVLKRVKAMPTATYEGKVLVVRINDLAYAGDFSAKLDKLDLKSYVECRGVGQPIKFYTFGDDVKLKSAVGYATRSYNTKFRRVVSTAGVEWKKFLGSLDEQWCDHVLTMCSLPDFYDEVTTWNTTEPIPGCEKSMHARRLPAYSWESTIGGRYRPIVPYDVEPAGDEDYHSVSMLNNEQRDTICFCKCKQ